jgi:hypothetical protein
MWKLIITLFINKGVSLVTCVDHILQDQVVEIMSTPLTGPPFDRIYTNLNLISYYLDFIPHGHSHMHEELKTKRPFSLFFHYI